MKKLIPFILLLFSLPAFSQYSSVTLKANSTVNASQITGVLDKSHLPATTVVYPLVSVPTQDSVEFIWRVIDSVVGITYVPLSQVPSFDQNTNAMLAAMGSTLKAWPMASPYPSSSNASGMTNDQINFIAVYLPAAATITGVKFALTQAGSYTATGYNGVALYSASGGTLTLVASSTNNGSIWAGSINVISSQAFSSTYSAAAGLYYIAVAYDESAQTTQPKLGDVLGLGTANLLDFTNNNRFSGFLGSTNTLPTPTEALSSLGNGGAQYWVALY